MKSLEKGVKSVLGFIVLLMVSPSLSLGLSEQARCSDVLDRGHLNVLTINLLFSEIEEREIRLERIVDFVEEEQEAGESVDVILLQEVVGGPLSRTFNSALDLKDLLAARGLEYNLRYRLANGIPGILTVGNAVLSRCEISFTLSKTLPFVSEEIFDGIKIPLRRKVMMSRIRIPGFGRINVYNTHLCAFCDPEERLEQAEELLDFLGDVEAFIWWDKNPVILGGDFNTNLNMEADLAVYDLITIEGFIDTYAEAGECPIPLPLSCCLDYGDPGCTFAASEENPFAVDLFTREPETPKRIDYIFIMGENITVETGDSVVVFNSDPDWVSDHSGVLARIQVGDEHEDINTPLASPLRTH